MNKENIKRTVKNAFNDVDSVDFLQKKLDLQIKALKMDYDRFIKINPGKNYKDWKEHASEINLKTNSNSEILTMGIYLLALDKFKPDG